MNFKNILLFSVLCFSNMACNEVVNDRGRSLMDIDYSPTLYNVEIPNEFPIFELPDDNDLTIEKIELGQYLFFDPILSADSTMACASCHFPEEAFTDNLAVSIGIDGIAGEKSSMSLVNTAFYNTGLFWDGRVGSLEEQALLPVEDPIEMHNKWPELIDKLRNHDLYPMLFRQAFGIDYSGEMTKEMVAKALSQYQRIIISGNSKYDKFRRNEGVLSDRELEGLQMFFKEDDDGVLPDPTCIHCHNGPLFTDHTFRNNGLEDVDAILDYPDWGYGSITGFPQDYGKFRVPSLRNIALTAPYMHDGRFETLEEVIDHYDQGGISSPNRDLEMQNVGLTEEQKVNLKLFLLTLTDTSYMENRFILNPFN